jgi:hypothetical protein
MLLAHNVSAGSLPAPAWLLGYIGAFVVFATALALRSGWTSARLGAVSEEAFDDQAAWTHDVGGGRKVSGGGRVRWVIGHLGGTLLLVGVMAAALSGPDTAAANIAPVAVFVMWWVCLPLVSLLVGDVMRAINPFVPVVQWVERMRPNLPSREHLAPAWTAAVFLWAFEWYFVAYHRPGSPRATAVLLGAYIVAALAGGVFWGTRWVMRGEGFGGLSAGVAGLVRPRPGSGTGALLPIAVVVVATTGFDALTGTGWWVDVAGATTGWTRTAVDTVGLVWATAVVGVVVVAAVRVLTAADQELHRSVTRLLGVALLPVALAWFLAHDLTLLLLEGQNFIALLSDPIGRGWDLFGTIDRTIDYRLFTAGWVRWIQLAALLAGHAYAVVLAHDGAIALLGRRKGMRVTWAVAVTAAVSIVAAALLELK